jgi:hypothetical protein
MDGADEEVDMALRVVGAGFPRTGTTSLKAALERLLGAPCYHMSELFAHPDHAVLWRDAAAGAPDWDALFAGYSTGVDWPVSSYWRELCAAYPDAIVLLSRRESPERWHESMDRTVFGFARRLSDSGLDNGFGHGPPWLADASEDRRRVMQDLMRHLFNVFPDLDDRAAVMGVYERHLAEVRSTVPDHRLLEWQPSDGWAPLCAALGVTIPDEPFPRENAAAEMIARGPAWVTSPTAVRGRGPTAFPRGATMARPN